MDAEVLKLIEEGPGKQELKRLRSQWRSQFISGLERIGGFRGVSSLLGAGEVYEGDPGAHLFEQKIMLSASSEQIRQTAKKWLQDGDYRRGSQRDARTGRVSRG